MWEAGVTPVDDSLLEPGGNRTKKATQKGKTHTQKNDDLRWLREGRKPERTADLNLLVEV